MERSGTFEQMREFVVHRSAYQLKEGDGHTFAIPRLAGAAKQALVHIQAGEYGTERPGQEMHATLFAATMTELGLDATPNAYVDLLPAATLATDNLVSYLGLHRARRGALVGHLTVLEMTSVTPMGRYSRALERLGGSERARRFYEVHVLADAEHERIALREMAGRLADRRARPVRRHRVRRPRRDRAGTTLRGARAELLGERHELVARAARPMTFELADATYVLPIRRAAGAPPAELTAYLRGIARLMPVLVVDGSDPPVFAEHRRAWAPEVRHEPTSPEVTCRNGKVRNVLTALPLVDTPVMVIADDDVRWDPDVLRRCVADAERCDVVQPQNHFDPLPWHAVWDTARTLFNRAFGTDFAGTLVVRTAVLRATGGYDGDVLFENLELMRTVRAAGGSVCTVPDAFVVRRPPETDHFLGQRVRQAYDEWARPWRLAAFAALGPAIVAGSRHGRRRWLVAAVASLIGIGERGRRRAGGADVFPIAATACVPLWVLERTVCTWVAIGLRLRGGVRYAGARLPRAASSTWRLRRRLGAAHRPLRSAPRTSGVPAG